MILPNKYISLSDSLIGISSLVLETLSSNKMSIDDLWDNFNRSIRQNKKIKNIPTYNKFVLVINFMYMTNMINYTEKGVIYNENIEYENI